MPSYKEQTRKLSPDEPDAVDREEHEHGLAEHQAFGNHPPPTAVRTLGAVVAETHIVAGLDIEDVGLGEVTARPAASRSVVNVAKQLDVLNRDLSNRPDTRGRVNIIGLHPALRVRTV